MDRPVSIVALLAGLAAQVAYADNQAEIGSPPRQERTSEQNPNAIWPAATFEIRQIGVREGTFIFNGTHDGRERWREVYTVDAGEGGNVRVALVKKIAAVIRKYKSGDFEFDSRRLGHRVQLSGRPSDDAALEAFLMKEFFDGDASGR